MQSLSKVRQSATNKSYRILSRVVRRKHVVDVSPLPLPVQEMLLLNLVRSIRELKSAYNVRMGTFEILHCKVQDFAHWNIHKVQNKLPKCGTIYCRVAYSKCAMCNDLHIFMCKTMFFKK